jgi:hypothetical protein
VLVSLETWNKLRTFAYNRESKIKTVVDDIVNGKIQVDKEHAENYEVEAFSRTEDLETIAALQKIKFITSR